MKQVFTEVKNKLHELVKVISSSYVFWQVVSPNTAETVEDVSSEVVNSSSGSSGVSIVFVVVLVLPITEYQIVRIVVNDNDSLAVDYRYTF